MNVLVAIKQVIDHNIKVKIKSNNKEIETKNIKTSINPFDEIALEEAIKLKENKKVKKTISVTCGNISCIEILQKSMAMGIEKSILINNTQKNYLSPLDIAKSIKKITEIEKNIKLIILGKQSIDYDNNQTGQMLAGLLNWPQATSISKIKIKNEKINIISETNNGYENLSLNLPAVVTVDLRLNEPRYITLLNIIKARKKNIKIIKLNSLNINFNKNIKILKLSKSIIKKKKLKLKILIQ